MIHRIFSTGAALLTAFILVILISCEQDRRSPGWVDQYNVSWTSQSENSAGSMPLVGGNVGCNVWVEGNELMYYFSSPGNRDENGSLMKFGRIRISFEPDIFEDAEFEQLLNLPDGSITISTRSDDIGETIIKLWVEIQNPVIHTDIESNSRLTVNTSYENWRTDLLLLPYAFGGHKQRGISYSNYPAYDGEVYIWPDEFEPAEESMVFYHRMRMNNCFFPMQIKQQGLEDIKDQLYDPLTGLTFGGKLTGENLAFIGETEGQYGQTKFTGWKYRTKDPSKKVKLRVYTHISQTETPEEWKKQLNEKIILAESDGDLWKVNVDWWKQFWDRSHIIINQHKGPNDQGWQIARNYNLFRYMLVSGFYALEPTMFNGGVLTFDPEYEKASQVGGYTPDYRRWGAALTAQNQRLAYWPMLKNGDFDGILPQFDWYKNTLPTTRGRVKYYWGHEGCMCVEQPTITGMLGMAEFGFDDEKLKGTFRYRPPDYEKGCSNNPSIGRLFGSQLENSWMMLRYYHFTGNDISEYLPFIEQSVLFYDENFRMRERKRSGQDLDEKGKLVIYPTNTLERHPYSRNPTAVLAGLKVVLQGLIDLPDDLQSIDKKERWKSILETVPDYPIGEKEGHKYLKPAENWERNHRAHSPEMYPLYPYELFGLGLPDFQLMKNTVLLAAPPEYIASSGGWNQNLIHAARLGLTDLAKKLVIDKIENGPHRFPGFFPGGDYAPDHNVGGAGMIGLQEMIMQTHDNKIRILPAWPAEWNVDFKLHAPGRTMVEAKIEGGKVTWSNISPEPDKGTLIIH